MKMKRILPVILLISAAFTACQISDEAKKNQTPGTPESTEFTFYNGEIYDNGYDSGYDSGKELGEESGYNRGYQEGYDKGNQDGYKEGYYDGKRRQNKEVDSKFVNLEDYMPDAVFEIRYCTNYNFIGNKISNYNKPYAFLSKEAALSLKAVNDELKKSGYRLKVYCAYIPQTAQNQFDKWLQDEEALEMKDTFYPNLDKEEIAKSGFIEEKLESSRGSSIDVTIFCDATGKELDMGGCYDYFDVSSETSYTGELTKEQISNRKMLKDIMEKNGFSGSKINWWHFTLKDEPYPDTYFDFSIG